MGALPKIGVSRKVYNYWNGVNSQLLPQITILISEVQPVHKEQLKGTQAMVSCVVTGLTEELDADEVEWKKATDDSTITSDDGDGFSIETGTFDDSTGSQTTTLTVPDSQTNEDKVYKCVITPNGDEVTAKTKEVNLKVFCK